MEDAVDREELGKASAGISEISGKACHFFTDFQCQLGSAMAPTPAYGALDPSKALMSRPALRVVSCTRLETHRNEQLPSVSVPEFDPASESG